ncbi:MAG: hypothetical protein ACT4QF_21660 [Sporichthyaceae bacterium]
MGRNASAVLDSDAWKGAVDARDRLAPAAANAAAALKPHAANAAAVIGPQLVKAREVAKTEVLPRVVEGLHTGRAAAEPVAVEAFHRGKAAAAALAGAAASAVPQKKQTHKVRTTLLVGAAVGAGVAAWKAWKLPHGSEDWTQADTYNAQKDVPKTTTPVS